MKPRYAGQLPYHLARAARDVGREWTNPADLAMRLGPDLLAAGIYASSVPEVDGTTRLGLGVEDLGNSIGGGAVLSFATRAALGMTPLRRMPGAIGAAAGIADLVGSFAGSMFGPHPIAADVAKKREVKMAMEAEKREREIYEQGLSDAQRLHNAYSPEEQILNALIPGNGPGIG